MVTPHSIYAESDPAIISIQENLNNVGRWEKFELTLEIEAQFNNPYDPEEVNLSAQFISPNGKNYNVLGFYFQDYIRTDKTPEAGNKNICIIKEVLEPKGKPVWKIRFTPQEVGSWKYKVTLSTKSGFTTSDWRVFRCLESKKSGFIRTSDYLRSKPARLFDKFLPKRNNYYFIFDDGTFYFPIGQNLAWPDSQRKTYSYDEWCALLKENGANFFRLWFAPWFLALEWKETGLGKYNQERAWDLDYIVDLSQRLDLYFMLCFIDHGQFSVSHNPEWKNNPYNIQNKGPCKTPAEFLTNETAKKLFKMRLRYIVSRYGFSPNIMSWEWFNEAELADINLPDLLPWIKEMNQYLKELDPYDHMISTSFHHENPDDIWGLPEISFTQRHVYEIRDYSWEFSQPKYEEMFKKYNKPFLIGEFGWMKDINRSLDKTGLHLHEGLWAGAMAGFGGTPLIWYWDVYVDPNELYYHYKALANFIKGEELSHFNFTKIKIDVSAPNNKVKSYGRQCSAKALFWLKNEDSNLDEYIAYLAETAKNKIRQERGLEITQANFPTTTIKDCDIIIKDLANGKYDIEWWDTTKGEVISRSQAVCWQGVLKLRAPVFSSDIAGKAIKAKSWWQGWWWK